MSSYLGFVLERQEEEIPPRVLQQRWESCRNLFDLKARIYFRCPTMLVVMGPSLADVKVEYNFSPEAKRLLEQIDKDILDILYGRVGYAQTGRISKPEELYEPGEGG